MSSSFGTITSLGVGSGFDLQQMLEDFREIDEAPIQEMEDEITVIEERITKYSELNTKLFDMKSHALALTLESNFITRSVSVSDEDVASAEVFPGSSSSSTSIEVMRKAMRSSWQTNGVESADTTVYIPTIQQSVEGYADTDTTAVVDEAGSMTVVYGPEDSARSITVDLAEGMTLNDVVNAINSNIQNDDGEGSTLVTASTVEGVDGNFNIKIASTLSGSTEANRVMIADSPENFSFEAPEVSFAITLGTGDPVEISVAADTTYSELAQQINEYNGNPGVTASIINDGSESTPYRLVLTADNTGEDNRISISGIQMNEVQGADDASLNAEISVDGILYQRQSNTGLTDIIEGVSLTIKNEGPATISVSPDPETAKTEIIGLVETFNELVQEIKTSSAYDEDGEEWGILSTSITIKGLPNDLSNLMTKIMPTNDSITNMFDLGLEMGRDGAITINEETLDAALASDPEAVALFFLGDEETGIEGFADKVNNQLRDITSSNGLLGTEKTYAEQQIDRMEENIDAAMERLDRKYDVLIRQFVELDKYIGQLNNESAYLTQVFDSIESGQQKK